MFCTLCSVRTITYERSDSLEHLSTTSRLHADDADASYMLSMGDGGALITQTAARLDVIIQLRARRAAAALSITALTIQSAKVIIVPHRII